jgi:ubiquinol-cytochrome c reductase cytochrome b subunit
MRGANVFRFLRDWIDDRTGLGKVIDALLLEPIPGGARWRYVWGSALAIVFGIQILTGVLLMTAYSPSDATAWSSVYFIQYEMDFGWLIRGLHHFGSQTMVVLMGLHMLQVVIAGAHLKPREVNWWLGLGLMGVVLGLSLTGYLLPWDQKGFYATQVATNIVGGLGPIGPWLQKIIVGGSTYGHHTLTRFFALHVAILPGIAILLLIAHLWVFRRHGVTHPRKAEGTGWFWPDQAFRDMVVGLVIFGIMLGLVVYGWGNQVEPTQPGETVASRSTYDRIAHAGLDGRGAHLDAPADPNVPYPARPEWYFLFLFQLLKYFEGDQALIGTVVIPGAVAVILFALPWLGYGKLRPVGHAAAVLFVIALLGGAAYLTAQAWVEDQSPETLEQQPWASLKQLVAAQRYDPDKARAFQNELEHADARAKRAVQLAREGTPAIGSRYLLRHDPLTAGKELFRANCATCHSHDDPDADGRQPKNMNDHPTAPDLTGWGTRDWLRDFLTHADGPRYFSRTHLKSGKMSKWSANARQKAHQDPQFAEDLETIATWLATHPRHDPPEEKADDLNAKGYRAFDKHCAECHSYQATSLEDLEAPDLAGYGDARWLREMIMAPQHPTKYGKNNQMPGFRDLNSLAASVLEEPFREKMKADLAAAGDDPAKKEFVKKAHQVNTLTDLERELIIRFIRRDGRVVHGGEPIGD